MTDAKPFGIQSLHIKKSLAQIAGTKSMQKSVRFAESTMYVFYPIQEANFNGFFSNQRCTCHMGFMPENSVCSNAHTEHYIVRRSA